MNDNKIKERRDFHNYLGANYISGEESTHKGYTYRTAQGLIENVVAKKELTLFSENGGNIATTTESMEYVNKKGKRVSFSPIELKVITAFAQVLDTEADKEENKEYIKKLPLRIDHRRKGEDGKTKMLPNPIRCIIDIPMFAKLVYSSDRIGGKQADKVKEVIKNLSTYSKKWKLKDERGGTYTIEAPIINMGKSIKYEQNGVEKFNRVEIIFEDVFVYELDTRYSLSPITLLRLWNGTGVQTELFTTLLLLLQSLRGNYTKHAHKIVQDREKELKKQKKDKEDIRKELEALRKEKLTYKEAVASLLERIDSKRYYKGKYLRKDNLNKDLKQATDALLQMGIISDFYETTGASGERICNFVFNDNWIIDETKKIKAEESKILPKTKDIKGKKSK